MEASAIKPLNFRLLTFGDRRERYEAETPVGNYYIRPKIASIDGTRDPPFVVLVRGVNLFDKTGLAVGGDTPAEAMEAANRHHVEAIRECLFKPLPTVNNDLANAFTELQHLLEQVRKVCSYATEAINRRD